ncbi:MAG: hypothetical protein ACI8TP_005346, partial [Acidimicrobiales bacterium]
LARPDSERHVLVSAFRLGGHEWIGYDPHPPLATNGQFKKVAAELTPREMALLGVPLPGHPYWTSEMLVGMAELYPGLDLEPWRVTLT